MGCRAERRSGGVRPSSVLLVAVATLLLAAACTAGDGGGDGGGEGAIVTEPGDPAPGSEAGTVGAVAGIVFEGRTYTYIGGECEIPEDRAFVRVDVGRAGGADFFRFALGGEPGAPPLEGGETYFVFTVRGAKDGARFGLDEGSVTLAEDLREGTFSGDAPGGGPPVAGSFSC